MHIFRTSILALSLLSATCVSANAAAQPMTLVSDWFYTDASGYALDQGYGLSADRDCTIYNVSADFVLGSTSITDSTVSLAYLNGNSYIYNTGSSGPVQGNGEVTTIGSILMLPPGAAGVVEVEFAIQFEDGTYLNDFRHITVVDDCE